MVHASFPGGRSGATREESGGSFDKKAPSTKGSECHVPNVEWDVRFVAGLGADPDAHAFNPEYFEVEGLKGDEARRALPEDASLAAELAAAAAAAAAKAREGEVRDALYLSVVHKFNACGVPLVVDPGDYGANALPSVRPSRHSRHPLGARGVVGALERAVAAAPGAGDASARRRRRRFAEKTRRLQREMLPEGAEALLDEHLESIVADAAAASSAIEQLREEGPEGAAAADALADATSLARVYRRSARYGYFLRAVQTRVRLERCIDDDALHVDRLHDRDREPMLCRAHGVANALRPAPRLTARDALLRDDAASMWLRASRGDAGMSSKADMASLASNIVGPLPAYPDSVGDWVEPVEEATAWLKAEAPEESWRSRRRRRRDEERRAAALSAGAYQASIGDWIADDHVDDEPTPPAKKNPGDARRLAAPREQNNAERDERAANENLRGDASSIGDATPIEEESRLARRRAFGDETRPRDWRLKTPENAADARPAPPSLSAVVSSMDVGLRASLAQIAGEETRAVLRDHVDALFGTTNRSRSAASRTADAASAADPERLEHGIAYPSLGDVSGNAAAAPLDALRYLVVEAAAFGAGLHAAEKLGERYDLLHARRDAYEA